MRVRGRRLLPLLIALLVMAGAFSYGAVRTSGEIWSHLETGSVKIGIETLGLEHGTFRKLPQEVIVDCEKPVSYVPRITNRGETCYLRVRLLAKAGDQELELADHLQDIQSGWIRKGEYLYYQEPVAYGRSVDVCQGFQLPEEWDFYQEKNLQLRTEADALQAKNFKPDLAAENPWGDLVVTASQIGERKSAEGGGTCGRGIAGDGRKPMFDHCRPGERTGTGRGRVFLTYYAFAGRQP